MICYQLNSIDIAVLFVVMDDKANIRANLDIETPPIARRPGRPKGQPKAPGSGRKPGTPNRHTRDVRAEAAKHSAKALKTLVKLLGDPDPKVQATAAREILDRAHGRPAQTIDAKVDATYTPPESDKDTVKRLLFMFAKADRDGCDESGMAELLSRHYPNAAKVLPAPRTIKVDRPHEPEAARRVITLDATGQVVTPPDDDEPTLDAPAFAARPMLTPSPPPDKAWAAHLEMKAAPWRSANYTPSTAPTTIRRHPKG